MSIAMLLDPTAYIMPTSGYRSFASLLFGTNGTESWIPELSAGTSSSNLSSANRLWDSDLDDGFDSGTIAVQYSANLATGASAMTVGSGSPLSHAGTSGGTIGSVVISAKASGQGQVDWSNLTVTFWNGSTVAETVSVSDGPTADAWESQTTVEEQRLVVTPESSTYTSVTVSGSLRLQGDAYVVPGISDLFGQILIMPA